LYVRRVRAFAVFTVAVAVIAVSFVVARALSTDPHRAELSLVHDIESDVAGEVGVAWGRFVEAFPGRLDCIDDVLVELVRWVENGESRYVVGQSRVEIMVPVPAAEFRESLVHELAHHVEHTCDEFDELRIVLEPLLGGGAASWAGSDDDPWADRPAERWAEAVVEFVNGERIRHADDFDVDAEVLDLIEAWGSDRSGD
jgi:hypothetical protein